MKKYKVWVCLEAEFDGDEAIEAETEEEAFVEASNIAMMGGGFWQWNAEEIKEEEEEEEE